MLIVTIKHSKVKKLTRRDKLQKDLCGQSCDGCDGRTRCLAKLKMSGRDGLL